jgi:hypothetical protein
MGTAATATLDEVEVVTLPPDHPVRDELALIEDDLARRVSSSVLMERLERLQSQLGPSDQHLPRLLMLRGALDNRLRRRQSALRSLHLAREGARRAQNLELLGRIALNLAIVHSWRATNAAALELLGAFAAAQATDDRGLTAEAIAEAARLNIENGRYEAALELIGQCRLSDALLSEYELARLEINRCQALIAIGRCDDALAAAAAARQLVPDEAARLSFMLDLTEAYALHRTGRHRQATDIASRLAHGIAADARTYEHAEYQMLAGYLGMRSDPEQAQVALRTALYWFVADSLPRHEIECRTYLAECLKHAGADSEARDVIREAVRCASRERLSGMGDRVRANIAALWPGEQMLTVHAAGDNDHRERFMIVRDLGGGGSGNVSEGFDLYTGERVAIKKIDLVGDRHTIASRLEQIGNEMAVLRDRLPDGVARARYLNLTADRSVVIVQDLVDGPTLRQLMDERVERGRLLLLLSKVTRTVARLHQNGVEHRDIKPDNIVVRDGIEPVLVDFGIALIEGRQDRLPAMGSPGYVAPERRIGGAAPFGAGDVYALGRIGMAVWPSAARDAGSRWPRWLARMLRRGSVSDPLETLLSAMTAEDAFERYSDLFDAADRFEKAFADQPTARR